MTQKRTHSGGDSVLEIRNLWIEGSVRGEPIPIIKGVDLMLAQRQFLGLIGESGAGKSTLGLAGMGYVRPGCRVTRGEVIFDGIDLLKANDKTRRGLLGARIAYIAQSATSAFNPAHRIREQVVEAAVCHGLMSTEAAHERALELFRKLQLPSPQRFGQAYPHQVSGGQLQRAMVAMAMVCSPDMLVFDEPTTALDVTTQLEVLIAMKEAIADQKVAALYITHDLAVVAQIADQIKVLRHGETVEDGPTEQIINDPQQEYTQQLVHVREVHKRPSTHVAEAAALSLNNISAAYGRGRRHVPVLRGVNYAVRRGETAAIVGESGSGKSTLARVATGLLPLRDGSVELDGRPLNAALKHRTRDQMRRIQMIYQSPDASLNPSQRIEEIIGRPLTFYFGIRGAERRQRVAELLAQVDLPATVIQRRPNELSGGQKQRIAIARALAAEPDVIICDEVTSALDQVVAKGVLRLLQRLQEETGTSYVFITHDLTTVRAIAHTVTVMYRGEVVESGSTEEVLGHPTADYTKTLLASVPLMKVGWLDEVRRERRTMQCRGMPGERVDSKAVTGANVSPV